MAKDRSLSITLTWYEMMSAAHVGILRNVESIRQGKKSTRGKDAQWERHVLGALGECAFCKATNRYWSASVNTYKDASDAGSTLQIRTRSRHDYDLIIRDDDRDEDTFVLVTGGPDSFLVHGYMLGKDGKKPSFKSNHGGYGEAYFVPKNRLSAPMDLVLTDGM